ncbi:MAG TPA: hypothetical protein PKC39_03700 [Ferruginibacter sp.]|nr:hypothetical protein [Ferruginibacter sp.]HMP20043.1 hypothetical protein [Ferruginibacter sp.]
MKKMFILLISTLSVTAVLAQPVEATESTAFTTSQAGYGPDWHDGRHANRPGFHRYREMDMRISRINWEYDRRIAQVWSRPFVSRFKKERQVRQLEQQRWRAINRVYADYGYRVPPGRRW